MVPITLTAVEAQCVRTAIYDRIHRSDNEAEIEVLDDVIEKLAGRLK
jgi:hypothetical protein